MKILYFLLAVGTMLVVGIFSSHWGFDFGSLGTNRSSVQVQWHAVSGPDGKLLDMQQMVETKRILQEESRHLRSASLYVDRNLKVTEEVYGAPKPKQARYTISLELADGTRLEAKSREADWSRLDQEMAATVKGCILKYQELRKRHGLKGPLKDIRNF